MTYGSACSSDLARPGGVRAVLLDVGGVFYLPDHGRVTRALNSVGVVVDPSRIDRAHYAGVSRQELAAPDPGERGAGAFWLSYLQGYVEELHVASSLVEAAIAALLVEFRTMSRQLWSRMAPGTLSGLRAIARSGVAVAVVSNFDGTLERSLARANVCQVGHGAGVRIAAVFDSGAFGWAKPDPRIFEAALDALGVPASHAVHVGDTVAADVAGARNAGIRPLHFDPFAHCVLTDHQHVRSLDDVVAVAGSGLPTPPTTDRIPAASPIDHDRDR